MKSKRIPYQNLLIFTAGALLVLTGYFTFIPRMLSAAAASQIEMVVLGALALVAVVMLVVTAFTLAITAFSKDRSTWLKRLGDKMIFLAVVIGLLAAVVLGSQWAAHTPPILGANGRPLPGSIAAMETVNLGGANQWLIIRGENIDKPVLLFLSGGPGASEAARVLRFNQALEKHFVVVIWEQRGCGKSYPSRYPLAKLTIDQYKADIIELTNILRARFGERKIYLAGHSWGSVIGLLAAQARPDLFHAYIGSAQMVDVPATDKLIYDMVLDYSRQTGDAQFVKTLETQGRPPYLGRNPILPYSTLFGREYSLYEYPNIKDEAYRRDGDILMMMLKQPEYGWLDRLYYLLGLMNTFNTVYPQLQSIDFRRDAPQLNLPVYLMLGRHDMNNPYQIPEEYFRLLEAPHKQLIFFEDSGHGMIWEQADLYHQVLTETILPETYQP